MMQTIQWNSALSDTNIVTLDSHLVLITDLSLYFIFHFDGSFFFNCGKNTTYNLPS